MDNLTFDKKYRPKTFDDMIGNEEIINQLVSIINSDRKPSSILLQGPSGCGKTTLSRILAVELKAGKRDIKELNISNIRGIDAARSIIESIKYAPISGKAKVIILNECHHGTKEFWNALLEALEEPPNNVHFILCTTDPQKILKTVKTRCMVFEVSTLKRDESLKLIKRVLKAENKKDFPKEAIKKIAQVSNGSARKILVNLDSVINLDNNKILENIKAHEEEEETIIGLCQALLKSESWKSVASILKGLKDTEPETVRYTVLGYMRSVLLNSGNKRASDIIELFSDNFYDSKQAGLVNACFYACNI